MTNCWSLSLVGGVKSFVWCWAGKGENKGFGKVKLAFGTSIGVRIADGFSVTPKQWVMLKSGV